MHGLVCSKFQEFYISNFGLREWDQFAKKAGIDTHFELTKSYSDKMFMRILVMALEIHKLNARETLESFGKFLTPFLLKLYQPKDDWTTLDLLEHTESEIHATVRMRDRNAAPPRLQIKRWDRDEVEIRYNSPRNIPFLGIGIIKGLAEHYNELDRIEIKARKLKEKSYSIRVLRLKRPAYQAVI
ncbi:MAG: heme NO-binding domain-containing protein [Cyclobacteriaceae bacterium]